MKKILSILGAVGLVATSSATVVSCGNGVKEKDLTVAFKKDSAEVGKDILNTLKITNDYEKNDYSEVIIFNYSDDANYFIDYQNHKNDGSELSAPVEVLDEQHAYYYVVDHFFGDHGDDLEITFKGNLSFQ